MSYRVGGFCPGDYVLDSGLSVIDEKVWLSFAISTEYTSVTDWRIDR